MDTAILSENQAAPRQHISEHPLDVLRFAATRGVENDDTCALIMITGTDGGAVRAQGALMAVTETGERCGYLSGGCIDADIALNAQRAIANNTPLVLRYGRGSPFTDIKLPCGGGIDLAIVPRPRLETVRDIIARLEHRDLATLKLSDLINTGRHAAELPDFTARYRPRLKLRIAGIGADPIALLQVAQASGVEAVLWSQDEDCRAHALRHSATAPVALTSPHTLPEAKDDSHTAFILMAHDPDWETPLLKQALQGDAFYIGAVGSPNTHKIRCETLLAAGIDQHTLNRIHGPVGLVPSMRDASMLAISCLAEIVGEFHNEHTA